MEEEKPRPSGTGRRSFLRGVAGGVAGGVVAGGAAGVAGGYAYRDSRPDPEAQANAAILQGLSPAVPFHGERQAGILPDPPRATTVVSLNSTAENRSELVDLFQTVTGKARFLTAGGTAPPPGISGPTDDSGILGSTVVPDGLTVTFGVGSTLFDDRYGLASKLPSTLTTMTSFPNDDLDPAQCDGDLVLQLSAGDSDAVVHAVREITRATRGGMQVNWRMDGFASPARPTGTVPRNLMGFMDGISQPSSTDLEDLLWIDKADDQAWAAGGSYLVVRLIRMLVEFWDRVDVVEQEQMFGRYRPSGYPLDADGIYATPNYAEDPLGDVIPLNSHMRLANPRTPQTADSRILRRAWNYDQGIDQVGDLDQGLIFTCYQKNVQKQFETVQTRLIGEPLVDYIMPFGGGYFLVLPGVRDTSDWYGSSLLA